MFGYRLVKKSDLEKLDKIIEDMHKSNREVCIHTLKEQDEFKKYIDEKEKLIESLTVELSESKKKLDQLNAIIQKEKTQNSVTLTIADDLTTITPLVRSKSNAFETLFQNGYITDAQNNQHSIELGLMLIANEALSQLLEQFEEQVRGD